MEEVFDILKEFHKLVQNGWLTDKEAEQYASDKGIIESMNGCTSPQKYNIFNALKKVSIKKAMIEKGITKEGIIERDIIVKDLTKTVMIRTDTMQMVLTLMV